MAITGSSAIVTRGYGGAASLIPTQGYTSSNVVIQWADDLFVSHGRAALDVLDSGGRAALSLYQTHGRAAQDYADSEGRA